MKAASTETPSTETSSTDAQLPGARDAVAEAPATLTASLGRWWSRRKLSATFFALLLSLGLFTAWMKQGPRSASASAVGAAPVAPEAEDLAQGDLPAIRAVEQAMTSADRLMVELKPAARSGQVPLMHLRANPFRARQRAARPTGALDDAEEIQRREAERQSALQAVGALRLQAVLPGSPQRQCVINSTRCQEGQEAFGFLVEEIAANAVVVRRGIYRFELKLPF